MLAGIAAKPIEQRRARNSFANRDVEPSCHPHQRNAVRKAQIAVDRGVAKRFVRKATHDPIHVRRADQATRALRSRIPDPLEGARHVHCVERQAQQAVDVPVEVDHESVLGAP